MLLDAIDAIDTIHIKFQIFCKAKSLTCIKYNNILYIHIRFYNVANSI